MNIQLAVSLILAHIIGDFYLQTDKYCQQKIEKKLCSPFLYAHSIIIGVLSWIVVPYGDFFFFTLLITISHLLIDAIKTYFPKGLYSFVADQCIHLAIIIGIALLYHRTNLPLYPIPIFNMISAPLLLLAILLCMKPANILIRLILEKYKVGETVSCEEIKNAGALIGNLERILTVIFVLINQYEAIGFIIAAKSLLRFKDTDTAKTEYVLAGTFLSFGIALICGLLALL
jgi:hypothetical protein